METGDFVSYFHEDDDVSKSLIGCTFDDLYVRAEGCAYYALVGPTPRTGGANRVRRRGPCPG